MNGNYSGAGESQWWTVIPAWLIALCLLACVGLAAMSFISKVPFHAEFSDGDVYFGFEGRRKICTAGGLLPNGDVHISRIAPADWTFEDCKEWVGVKAENMRLDCIVGDAILVGESRRKEKFTNASLSGFLPSSDCGWRGSQPNG